MNISLCMICGNEAAVIESCLNSFSLAFDELCLVRAIGTRTPDETESIAKCWCVENGKKFVFAEYRNQFPDPHVDDFAAARNVSFSLATSDWCLWADCDDVIEEISARRLRDAADRFDGDGLLCVYRPQNQACDNLRERLIRRGKGRWKNPIHETCVVDGVLGKCAEIEILHRDHTHKNESSARRNAVILKRVTEDAARHFFYLHSDLKILGEKTEATAAAQKALALLAPSRVEEIYLVLLNLSELEPGNRESRLLEAARIQPHRREAFAYLCQHALIEGRLSDAVSWLRVTECLPPPKPLPWTHQGMWYGWAVKFLRVRVLRATGLNEMAEREHAENLTDPEYGKGVAEFEGRQRTN